MCQYRSVTDPLQPDFEALRCAAREVARGWSTAKTAMALRATGLDHVDGERTSLDTIAADHGVSRETVRRARNELLQAIELLPGTSNDSVHSLLSLHVPPEPSAETPATARALRRFLTMTGPLEWDAVVSAWSRAGEKPPYSRLPADIPSMRAWAGAAGGFSVTGDDAGVRPVTIAVVLPEELDQVGQFLLDSLRGRPGGVDRSELLELALVAGLKQTTIATALSIHPAVIRVGRGMWALRGRTWESSSEPAPIAERRRTRRARPTTFAWEADGSLLIEFSIPLGPSPVVAVPKAVSEIVEGREFRVEEGEKPMCVTVKNARLWGFGSSLSGLRLQRGARVTITLNLLTGKATITPTERKGTTQ